MKKNILTIVLLISALLSFAQSKDKIRQNAEEMVNAFGKRDFAVLLKYTYPRALAAAGGKDVMLKTIQNSLAQMEASGVTVKSATANEPGPIIKIGKRQFCIVPETTVMGVEGGTASALSYLLAISEDNGQRWYYLSVGSMKDSAVYQFFPELKGKMALPKQQQTVFTPDK